MRFWTFIILVLTTVSIIFYSTDLFERVSWNPFGNFMEPKMYSDDDPRTREYKLIENDNQPVWGTVNYGKLADLKTAIEDGNGTGGNQMGEAPPMLDMKDNAKAKSNFKPSPKGMNIHVLPGVQANDSVLNSFVFDLPTGQNLISPRSYYLSTSSVLATYNKKGVLTPSGSEKSPLKGPLPVKPTVPLNLSVFQVPYNDKSFIADTSGTVEKASDSAKAVKAINKSLNDLERLGKDNANSGELRKLIFKDGSLTTEFNNINALINTGKYAESYKYGLGIALGGSSEEKLLLPGVLIKSDLPNQDVYAQFDHLYTYMTGRKGTGTYAPALVDWAQDNADSILNLLMMNYMLQSQFTGTGGAYATPIYLSKWKEAELPFYKDLNKKGRKSKEPFYLYASIDPKVKGIKGGDGKTTPTIPSKYIHADLSYIFGLYTNIHAQVWIGANGLNTDGHVSQIWQDTAQAMTKTIKKDKVTGRKDLPRYANKISTIDSEYRRNNLTSGLSTARGAKDRTEEVYPNKEIIGALRTVLSQGEGGSGNNVVLGGKAHTITSIKKTKYGGKDSYGKLYKKFSGSDSYSKWRNLVTSAQKMPLHPAIFTSYWSSESQSAYIMMPTMLGGERFPGSLKIMLNDILKDESDIDENMNLSLANRYIMAFNFSSEKAEKSNNSTGVVEVQAGGKMGNTYDKSNPIFLTGYNGGESFSIIDYFKTQDALKKGSSSPPISVKDVKGNVVPVEYLAMFKDFFTVETLLDLGDENVTFSKDFNKDAYIQKYSSTINSGAKVISPDYTKFFTEPPTNVDGDKDDTEDAKPHDPSKPSQERKIDSQ